MNAIWELEDEDWGSTVGDQFLFARWGTRFADRRHGSGYKDPEPGTWRFLLPPENMAPAYLIPSSFDGLRPEIFQVKGLSQVYNVGLSVLANLAGCPSMFMYGVQTSELYVLVSQRKCIAISPAVIYPEARGWSFSCKLTGVSCINGVYVLNTMWLNLP